MDASERKVGESLRGSGIECSGVGRLSAHCGSTKTEKKKQYAELAFHLPDTLTEKAWRNGGARCFCCFVQR